MRNYYNFILLLLLHYQVQDNEGHQSAFPCYSTRQGGRKDQDGSQSRSQVKLQAFDSWAKNRGKFPSSCIEISKAHSWLPLRLRCLQWNKLRQKTCMVLVCYEPDIIKFLCLGFAVDTAANVVHLALFY